MDSGYLHPDATECRRLHRTPPHNPQYHWFSFLGERRAASRVVGFSSKNSSGEPSHWTEPAICFLRFPPAAGPRDVIQVSLQSVSAARIGVANMLDLPVNRGDRRYELGARKASEAYE
jgi:hypothetical protein